jgi:hypothetical protein
MNLGENISHIKTLMLINENSYLRRRVTPYRLETIFEKCLNSVGNREFRLNYKTFIDVNKFTKSVINDMIIEFLGRFELDLNQEEYDELHNDLVNLYQTRIYSYYHDMIRKMKTRVNENISFVKRRVRPKIIDKYVTKYMVNLYKTIVYGRNYGKEMRERYVNEVIYTVADLLIGGLDVKFNDASEHTQFMEDLKSVYRDKIIDYYDSQMKNLD